MRILWIPHTGWHIPQRAHLFCRALAKRHEVHVTDLVADFSSLRDYLAPRYARNFFYRRYHDGSITVHGVPRISPALFSPALWRLNTRIFSALVRSLIRRHQIEVVVSTFVLEPPVAARLIFDLFDENGAGWRAAGFDAYAEAIDQTERAYLQTADAVVAAGSVLRDKARAARPAGPIYLVPNGVRLADFTDQGREQQRASLKLHGWVAGLVGNHNQVAELDLALDSAQLLADEGFTLLIAGRGNAIPHARRRAERERIANVRFLDQVSLADLPALLAALDVGLCAYQHSPMDDARCPMRLLAYTAAGLPCVCTALEEVRRMGLPNTLLVDASPSAMADGLRQARTMPRHRPVQIEAYDIDRLVTRYEAICAGEGACDEA